MIDHHPYVNAYNQYLNPFEHRDAIIIPVLSGSAGAFFPNHLFHYNQFGSSYSQPYNQYETNYTPYGAGYPSHYMWYGYY